MKIYMITSEPFLTEKQTERLNSMGDFVAIEARKLSSSEVIKKVSDAEILIAGSSGINRIDKELLVGLTKLKFVSLLTIGTNWIDLEHAKKKGIVVSNAKGGTAESVAEHIWGMILGLSKRINEFERDVKDKGAYKFTDYKGMEVYGKTIGIIGLGDIGIKVARIARAFQMKVIGINKSGRKIAGVYLVSLDELLRKSDVIAVCIPLVEETKNMISKAEIKKMKDGVVLVNCAREEIVDKRIVLQGIKSGKIFGYGVETEIMKPVSNNDPYLKFSNVIVTPHNAFNTKEGELRVNDLMIENIKTYLKGKPINVVN